MKLEAGKYYRARDGRIFGPLQKVSDEAFPFYFRTSGIIWSWSSIGQYTTSPDGCDLIEEVEVTPVAPKTATFYVAAWWTNDGKASASIHRYRDGLEHSLSGLGSHGHIVEVELELPPKPEGTKP